MIPRVLVLLLGCQPLFAAPPTYEVERLTGEPLVGQLVALDAEQLSIAIAGEPQQVSLGEVVQITRNSKSASDTPLPPLWVELRDGSLLAGTAFELSESGAAVTWRPFAAEPAVAADFPSADIVAVYSGETPALLADWKILRQEPRGADLLAVYRKNRTELEAVEGVIEAIDHQSLRLILEEEPLTAPREKVFGFVLAADDAGSAPPTPLVEFTTGEQLAVRKVSLAEDRLSLVAHSGFSRSAPLALVESIDFSAGKLRYLSQSPPAEVTFASAVPLSSVDLHPWGLGRDRSLLGGPITVTGGQGAVRRFRHGLSLRSGAGVRFDRPAELTRFRATVGIDPAAVGTAELVISDESTPLTTLRLVPGASEELELDVSATRRLVIMVNPADNSPVGDIVNLGDARFSK